MQTATSDCWVQIYADTQFRGKTLKIDGPVEYPDLKNLPRAAGYDWSNKIASLKTGPGCSLILFDDPKFSGGALAVNVSESQPDLPQNEGLESMILSLPEATKTYVQVPVR